MKKIICLLLVAMMSISICACGGSDTSNNGTENNVGNSTEQKTYIINVEVIEVSPIYGDLETKTEIIGYKYKFAFAETKEHGPGTVGYETENTEQEFEIGDTVKLISGWNERYNIPNLNDILSVEKVEK